MINKVNEEILKAQYKYLDECPQDHIWIYNNKNLICPKCKNIIKYEFNIYMEYRDKKCRPKKCGRCNEEKHSILLMEPEIFLID